MALGPIKQITDMKEILVSRQKDFLKKDLDIFGASVL